MRIVVHGQQAFGKAVLEALLKRGENVIGVYVAPEKEGAKPDPLRNMSITAMFLINATSKASPVLASARSTASTACDQRWPSGEARMAGSKFERR